MSGTLSTLTEITSAQRADLTKSKEIPYSIGYIWGGGGCVNFISIIVFYAYY